MHRTLVIALLASTAVAQNYYSAALDGAQEVPPVAGSGRGWGVVRHDTTTNDVRIFVHHEALTGAPVAAHLHLGAAGVNGGIVLPLAPAGFGQFAASGTLTPAQATALGSAGTYLNVHTAANPGGEIRGQVVVSAATRFTGLLSGAQEVPPVATAASGRVVAWLHEPENRLVYMVTSTGLGNVLFAHFHQGASGVNGPIVVTLNGNSGTYCGVSNRLRAAEVTALMANGFYANIHTGANPGGELRAQLLADAGDHFATAMNGANEVPPNASAGIGSASAIVGVDGTIVVQGAIGGLTGPPTAAHVHVGSSGVNGPIVFPLTISGTTLSATHVPTTAQLANLRAGDWYVNVHTAANPGGEIRGQLAASKLPATFGSGCDGSNGVRPQGGARGLPVIGTTMVLDLYGALPGAPAVLAFGASRDTAAGAIPLPIELPALGLAASGCFLLVDPGTLVTAVADGFGCAQMPLSVPFNPALRGQRYHAQWFPFDPAANSGSFVATNGLTLLVQ